MLLQRSDTLEIKIDFSKSVGRIKAMHAVGQPPFSVGDRGIDDSFMHYMQEANIPFSRLHDTGGHFAFTDKLFETMTNYGLEPYFRLGVTIENAHFIKRLTAFSDRNTA